MVLRTLAEKQKLLIEHASKITELESSLQELRTKTHDDESEIRLKETSIATMKNQLAEANVAQNTLNAEGML